MSDFEVNFWSIFDRFGGVLGGSWQPSWPPRCIKNWIKMLTNFFIDFWSIWGRFFVNFASKLEGRGTNNHSKNYHMIDFLVNLALNWDPKPSKIRPKSFQKSIKKRSKKVSKIWSVFSSILEPNLAPRSPSDHQVGAQEGPPGTQLGPTCAQMGRTWQLRSTASKKRSKKDRKRERTTQRYGSRGGPPM